MAGGLLRIDLPLLDELRNLHRGAVAELPRDFDPGLASVGLIGLDEDMVEQDWRYESCTPLNAYPFATTGANGVHFGLMAREGIIDDRSPVLVTIPGAMGDSFVVGETLRDFLCLGMRRGFFALEQLSYDLDLTLEAYTNPAWQPSNPHHEWAGYGTDDYKEQMLSLLRSRLKLTDWGKSERFAALQDRYQPLLIYPPGHWGAA